MCGPHRLTWLEFPFLHNSTKDRISVIKWQFVPKINGGDEAYLHPLPISFKINATGRVWNSGGW